MQCEKWGKKRSLQDILQCNAHVAKVSLNRYFIELIYSNFTGGTTKIKWLPSGTNTVHAHVEEVYFYKSNSSVRNKIHNTRSLQDRYSAVQCSRGVDMLKQPTDVDFDTSPKHLAFSFRYFNIVLVAPHLISVEIVEITRYYLIPAFNYINRLPPFKNTLSPPPSLSLEADGG
jgi:hypothetical protein